MALPDIRALEALPKARFRALGERLADIGFNNDALETLSRALAGVPLARRKPLRKWHLRRAGTPVANALRLLSFSDPITENEAHGALGEDLVAELLHAGFLVRRDDRIATPFFIFLHGDDYLLVDDTAAGEEAVMGSGATTVELTRTALPKERVRRALDFACGAGPTALALARRADQVVGTDINPRAVAMGRINAAINGITNVEFRVSDMFAAVEGESFDIIAAQPPFVPRPSDLREATYLYGGARGDEFPLRVLREAPGYLSPNGRCVLYVEWPEIEGDPLEARLQKALPSDAFDLLLVAAPPANLDLYAMMYSAHEHPTLDDAYEEALITRREHCARLHMTAIRPTFTVVRPARRRPGFCRTIDVRPMSAISPSSHRIGRFFSAIDLLSERDEALLGAKLRVPKGTTFLEERSAPDPELEPQLSARFSPRALRGPTQLTRELFLLVSLVHASESVAEAANFVARAWKIPLPEAIKRVVPNARLALERGLLDVRDS